MNVKDASLCARENLVEDAVRITCHLQHPNAPDLARMTGKRMLGQRPAARMDPNEKRVRRSGTLAGNVRANAFDLAQRPRGVPNSHARR